jgi:hypothetical protein
VPTGTLVSWICCLNSTAPGSRLASPTVACRGGGGGTARQQQQAAERVRAGRKTRRLAQPLCDCCSTSDGAVLQPTGKLQGRAMVCHSLQASVAGPLHQSLLQLHLLCVVPAAAAAAGAEVSR